MKLEKELFIVEGESAASSIRQALHKQTQEVLAMQGKLINASKASAAKVRANLQCQRLFETLACGAGKECHAESLVYSRILILTDPDVDGAHARALLLILFDRYLQPLIKAGVIFAVVPPLFRIKRDSSRELQYAWNEPELAELIKPLPKDHDYDVTRFKGVAQFSREECSALFLSHETRRQVRLDAVGDW